MYRDLGDSVGGARELIGFSGDKTVEAEFWIELERSAASERGTSGRATRIRGRSVSRLRCARCFEIEATRGLGREESCAHRLECEERTALSSPCSNNGWG